MSTQLISADGRRSTEESAVRSVYERVAKLDRVGMGLLRLGLIIVLC
jgi:hypothetical protein